jgi:hypothetical protein
MGYDYLKLGKRIHNCQNCYIILLELTRFVTSAGKLKTDRNEY